MITISARLTQLVRVLLVGVLAAAFCCRPVLTAIQSNGAAAQGIEADDSDEDLPAAITGATAAPAVGERRFVTIEQRGRPDTPIRRGTTYGRAPPANLLHLSVDPPPRRSASRPPRQPQHIFSPPLFESARPRRVKIAPLISLLARFRINHLTAAVCRSHGG